jgi:hypothetical protein
MVKEIASGVVENLKGQPLVLALVVINLLFVALSFYTYRSIATSVERRDKIITDLIERCLKVEEK